jgi:LacI family transcriptional regulator
VTKTDIIEFSKAVGVSPTTISHALSGKRPVSSETRELILRKMNELGYTPNARGQSLVNGRTHVIALGYINTNALDDPFIMQILRSIYRPLRERSYGLMLEMVTESGNDYDILRKRVMSHSVDGVIIIGGGKLPANKLAPLAQEWAPCIVIDNIPVTPIDHLGSIMSDSTQSIIDMVKLAITLGHRRVAFIGREQDEPIFYEYKEALRAHGIQLSNDNSEFTGPNASDGYEAFMRIMNSAQPPTFVFARTDTLAYGAIEAADALNISIPGSVSIAAHDDLPVIQKSHPVLSSIRIDCEALGNTAVDMLFDMLDCKNPESKQIKIESKFIARSSLDQAPGRSSA